MGLKRVVDVVQVLVLAAAAVFTVALFVADGSSPSATTAAGGTPSGEAIYGSNCAACHGSDGGGGTAPALGGGVVVERYPEVADQIQVITDGGNGMPSFGGALSPEEIEAVADYTRNDL